MPNWLKVYGKSVAAVAFVVITAAQAALSDNHVTTVEGVQIAIAAATAVGVYFVPLHPAWDWSKTVIAVILGVLNVAATLIMQGWVSSDWTALILAALTALGVGASPAQSTLAPVVAGGAE